MPDAAASSISGRPNVRRAARRGQRSFDATHRWVDHGLRHSADGYRLLDSSFVSLSGVERLARRCFRRRACDAGALAEGDGGGRGDAVSDGGRWVPRVEIWESRRTGH
ncbi:MAG: hypothetical protein OXP73_08355 [Chloroflexota bacterium]|nr:hypothetical protein [Chloroflexota bacterium]